MTLYKTLHHRYDINRLSVSRKEGGRKKTAVLKIASVHRYNNEKITLKSAKED